MRRVSPTRRTRIAGLGLALLLAAGFAADAIVLVAARAEDQTPVSRGTDRKLDARSTQRRTLDARLRHRRSLRLRVANHLRGRHGSHSGSGTPRPVSQRARTIGLWGFLPSRWLWRFAAGLRPPFADSWFRTPCSGNNVDQSHLPLA